MKETLMLKEQQHTLTMNLKVDKYLSKENLFLQTALLKNAMQIGFPKGHL